MSAAPRRIPSHPPPTADDVYDAILLQLTAPQRWRLFDRLVGRPELTAVGFRIAPVRLSPRPCASRDAELARLHDKEGLTYREIANLKHLKPRTVARAVQRFHRRPPGDSDSLSPPRLPYAS